MNTFTTADVAIVILNWNGRDLLRQFLPQVIKCSADAHIYVIDNASTDDSVTLLDNKFPEVELITLDRNLGYAGGYNEGLRQIKQALICCLNNDVEVSTNWLLPVLNSFNSNAETAIVQPKILDYKRRDHFEYAGAAGCFIDKYGYPYCRGRIFDEIEKDLGQYNDTRAVFWASGACLFIKRTTFEDLGGFDASFFAHMEEIDLCWRAFNNGYQTVYNGASHIFHVGGSTLSNSSPQKTYLNFRNSLFCLLKNSPSFVKLILIRLILDGIAGLRFLIQLQVRHFLAIIRAHLSFYSQLIPMFKKRKLTLPKRKDYYEVHSVVWRHFVKDRLKF
jgi:hypothetical protein